MILPVTHKHHPQHNRRRPTQYPSPSPCRTLRSARTWKLLALQVLLAHRFIAQRHVTPTWICKTCRLEQNVVEGALALHELLDCRQTRILDAAAQTAIRELKELL